MKKTKKILILFLLGTCGDSLKSDFPSLSFFKKKKQNDHKDKESLSEDQKDCYVKENTKLPKNESSQQQEGKGKKSFFSAGILSLYKQASNKKISGPSVFRKDSQPLFVKKENTEKNSMPKKNKEGLFWQKGKTLQNFILRKENKTSVLKEEKQKQEQPQKSLGEANTKKTFLSYGSKWLSFKKKPTFKAAIDSTGKNNKISPDESPLNKKKNHRLDRLIIPTAPQGGDLEKPIENAIENQEKASCLQRVLEYAMERDLNVQKASLEVKKASENLSKAMTGWRPSMNISADGSYNHLNDVNLINDTTDVNHKWIHGVKTTMDYNLFSGGQIVYSVKAARLHLNGAILKYFGTLQDVTAALTKAYIEVVSLTREVAIYKNFISYSEKAYTHTKAQYDFGLAKYTDLANAAMNFSNHINTFNSRRAKLVEARANLEQQTGCLLANELQDVPSLNNPKTLEEAMDIAKKKNPHLQALVKEEEAASYELKSATGKFAPVVSANGGVNFNNRNITGSQNELGYASGLEAGLSFQMPVPINGEIQSEVRNVRLNVNSARIELEKLRREIWAALRQLYAQYVRNTDSLGFLAQSAVLAKKSLEASQEEFLSGLMDMTTLVEIQNTALKSEIEYNAIRYNLQEISYEILKNIGSLTPESLGVSHKPLYEPYIKRYQNSVFNIRVNDSPSEKKAYNVSKNLYNLSSLDI